MPQSTPRSPRIIVALDFPDRRPALELIERLDPAACRVKIGKEMFTRYGPPLVEEITRRGFDLFLDLKFHDIPNTTAAACAAAADLGVWMINLHAGGGRKMMATARERLDALAAPPLLIAVTILTSLSREDIAETGLSGEPSDNVQRLARLAADSGMDGVVCSPREASQVRAATNDRFLLVTPGVRPAGSATNDQQRIATPSDALAWGSDYLVIGRPITAAEDPAQALTTIRKEIGEA